MRGAPPWFRRINDIRSEIEACDVQVFTRRALEDLFRMKKTATVALMRRIGGVGQVAQAQTVSRRHLLLFLHKVQSNPAYQNEISRWERLDRCLEAERSDLAGRRRLIPGVEREPDVAIDGLPGVEIRRGRLTVDFYGTEDLLRKLYELSQAIVQDWQRFERLAEEV
ncbi:MAG: hypothetical protein K1X42_14085 [Opitutaceae bacterium]|nr:hypothetical protein [Opitutaceae bacterium]